MRAQFYLHFLSAYSCAPSWPTTTPGLRRPAWSSFLSSVIIARICPLVSANTRENKLSNSIDSFLLSNNKTFHSSKADPAPVSSFLPFLLRVMSASTSSTLCINESADWGPSGKEKRSSGPLQPGRCSTKYNRARRVLTFYRLQSTSVRPIPSRNDLQKCVSQNLELFHNAKP